MVSYHIPKFYQESLTYKYYEYTRVTLKMAFKKLISGTSNYSKILKLFFQLLSKQFFRRIQAFSMVQGNFQPYSCIPAGWYFNSRHIMGVLPSVQSCKAVTQRRLINWGRLGQTSSKTSRGQHWGWQQPFKSGEEQAMTCLNRFFREAVPGARQLRPGRVPSHKLASSVARASGLTLQTETLPMVGVRQGPGSVPGLEERGLSGQALALGNKIKIRYS